MIFKHISQASMVGTFGKTCHSPKDCPYPGHYAPSMEEPMPLVPGGVEGEFQGRVYPVVVGLKAGPRTLHMFGEGTTWNRNAENVLVVHEPRDPSAPGGPQNIVEIPWENVAFIGAPMFLIETPPK